MTVTPDAAGLQRSFADNADETVAKQEPLQI